MLYHCLLVFYSGLIPTHITCFPTAFKSHGILASRIDPQWTYSTVLHFQTILFIFFFLCTVLFPSQKSDTRACTFIIWMKDSITMQTIFQAEVLNHFSSCTKYKTEDQSEGQQSKLEQYIWVQFKGMELQAFDQPTQKSSVPALKP